VTDSIDIGKAITHLFEDQDWTSKAIVGGLIALVPILNFTLAGYEVRVIRNVGKGEASPMPSWGDFGQMFVDGLWLSLARIILSLPSFLLIFGPFVSFYLLILFGAVFANGASSRDVEQALSTLVPVGLLAGSLCCGLGFLYSFLLGALFPAVAANYARRGTFASCFNIGEVAGFIRRNPSNYLMVWLTGFLAGLIYTGAVSVVNFIPCLNLILVWPVSALAIFWMYMTLGHAVGQLLALDAAHPAASAQQLSPAS
jgi:hypothetical protein